MCAILLKFGAYVLFSPEAFLFLGLMFFCAYLIENSLVFFLMVVCSYVFIDGSMFLLSAGFSLFLLIIFVNVFFMGYILLCRVSFLVSLRGSVPMKRFIYSLT